MATDQKSNKYLVIAVGTMLVAVMGFNYHEFFVKNDFTVIKQVSCDPAIESCFVSDCESNDSSCDSETVYKKIYVPSKFAGLDYESLDCSETSATCTVITCQADTAEDGENCFE